MKTIKYLGFFNWWQKKNKKKLLDLKQLPMSLCCIQIAQNLSAGSLMDVWRHFVSI